MNLLTTMRFKKDLYISLIRRVVPPGEGAPQEHARPPTGPAPASLLQETLYEREPHRPLRSAGLDLTHPGSPGPTPPINRGGYTHF